jgi:hypothetical protein
MSKGGKVKGKFSTISLPVVLIERIKKKIESTGFTSVGSYVEFLVRISLEEGTINKKETKLIQTDKEKVKARLHALGYM